MSDSPDQLKLPLPGAALTKSKNNSPAQRQPRAPSSQSQKRIQATNAKQEPNQETPRTTDGTIEEQKMTDQTKPSDFETMLSELEKVVGQLEGELKLEEALSLFERGMGLSRDCEKFLKAAQQKIELLKRSTGGDVATTPFAEESEALV